MEICMLYILYLGSLGAGCVDNEECELDRVCMSGACVNPCQVACSEDSFCQVKKHVVTCLQFEKVHSELNFIGKLTFTRMTYDFR